VAPNLGEAISEILARGELTYVAAGYDATQLEGAWLVVAATDDAVTNERVSADAHARRLWVNVVDRPALCSFIVPSIVDRSPLVVAISSSGAVPVLARTLRARIESVVPARYAQLAAACASLRPEVKARLPDTRSRRQFWERALESAAAETILAGDLDTGLIRLRAMLDEHVLATSNGARDADFVTLIGTGTGDPDLLSFRALRLLQRAEVVLSLPGVTSSVGELARRDATQRTLNVLDPSRLAEQLDELVARGERVCVLGPFDAFRSGPEVALCEALARLGVRFAVVPGIGAAP
jgi:uroporphyrin-III C-methyltransferase/precorrin-2 dehydrogenase/sirohydrochlorin ferrochelatase